MSMTMQLAFEKLFASPLRNGLTRPKRVRGTGVKMVNMGEIFAHDRIRDIPMDRVPLSDKESQKYLLAPGELLFARQSLVRSGAGKCSIFMGANEPVTFESHLIRARIDQHVADSAFYFYFFQSPIGRLIIDTIVEQVCAAGIRGSDLAKLLVPFPPLPEQRAIAHILGTLDDKIECNRRMNRTLEEMARSIFKSWFVDFDPVKAKMEGRQPVGMDDATAALFPDELVPSEMGMIPRGWRVSTLGGEMSFQYGKALKKANRKPGNVPVYGSNGVVGYHNEALVRGPGIVVGRKGNPGTVRWSAADFYPIDTTFYVVPRGQISSLQYLRMALRLQRLPGLAADSAVPGLNRNLAYMNALLVPPQGAIRIFDDTTEPLGRRIHENGNESSALTELRDALLPKLISGEIRIGDQEMRFQQ